VGPGWVELDRRMPFPSRSQSYWIRPLPASQPAACLCSCVAAGAAVYTLLPPPLAHAPTSTSLPSLSPAPAAAAVKPQWSAVVHLDNPSLQNSGVEKMTLRFKCVAAAMPVMCTALVAPAMPLPCPASGRADCLETCLTGLEFCPLQAHSCVAPPC
jgi:hypothetical protein